MFRRLLYFGFGFLLSILLLSLGPNNRLKETFVAYVNYFDMDKRVMYHLDKGEDTIFSKLAECQIECYDLDKDNLLSILSFGEINFDKSRRNSKPCQFYVVENQDSDYFISVEFKYCSQSDIVEVIYINLDLESIKCNC